MVLPPDFKNVAHKVLTAHSAASQLAALCPSRRVVVQAGGCAGLWPMALADVFETVYTFEPDALNFGALVHNCGDRPQVYPIRGALGAIAGQMGLSRPKAGAGLWRLDGAGAVPVLPLDAFQLPALDALVLDVEGSELDALIGAARTIHRCRPVIWLEWVHHTAALTEWLQAYGYDGPTKAHDIDAIFTPREKCLTT